MEAGTRQQKVPVYIEDEMSQSYVDYAMSVIVGRALPDVRDGLKPVHRRVLYAMHDMGNHWNNPYRKSARVVGDVIGKYHPHGDAAAYDAIVRLAQDFSMRYCLVDGQGNFGSIDGDPPAAMRYTEIRMARIAQELLADIDKETVDFLPNYDDSLEEPSVLPSRLPNLLINGASGIAVGMATNIPPHNLSEVIDGLIALVERPGLTIDELMEYIPGPDFPTGGFIHGREGISQGYKTGRGSVQMRARVSTETVKRTGKEQIIVSEIPYMVNKTRLLEQIANLVNDKKIEGIADLRDESDRDGMRIVVEPKRDAVPQIVINALYKHTSLQESFGVNMLAIIEGRPKLLNLKEILEAFLEHRRETVTRRTAYDLRKAEERLHILEGLRIALDYLDEVIKLIRESPDPRSAKEGLMAGAFAPTQVPDPSLQLSEAQAQAILEMRLQRLTGLERDKIIEEYRTVEATIAELRGILADEQKVYAIVVDELREIKEAYGDGRRTAIVDKAEEISIEDLIVEEDMVVTVSHEGYIKRNPITLYRAQNRGGKGKVGATTRDEDFVESLFVASTHSHILFFTTIGKVYRIKVHEVPQASRSAKGRPVVNLLQLQEGEKVSAFLPVREFEEGRYIIFATRNGLVKKTDLMAYSSPRATGIRAIALDESDSLIEVSLTDGDQDILLSTMDGQSIRFKEEQVRPNGSRHHGRHRHPAGGGRSAVVSMEVLHPRRVDSHGLGQRHGQAHRHRRVPAPRAAAARVVITMKTTERTGRVVGVQQVVDEDQLMLITDGGKIIRLRIGDIRVIGRNTQGVRLIDLDNGERVVSLARLAEDDS